MALNASVDATNINKNYISTRLETLCNQHFYKFISPISTALIKTSSARPCDIEQLSNGAQQPSNNGKLETKPIEVSWEG